jgi:primosomal protein N' (replication factor Y) (superfamily II helicase)
MLVRVPLNHRTELGIVMGVGGSIDFDPARLRNVLDFPFSHPVVSDDVLGLMQWIARYYACSQEAVFERVIPSSIRREVREKQESWMLLTDEGRSLRTRSDSPAEPPSSTNYSPCCGAKPNQFSKARPCRRWALGFTAFQALVDKGLAEETRIVSERLGYEDALSKQDSIQVLDFKLTEEQQAAEEYLSARIDRRQFEPILLHGVTGSGKTEVYVRAIRHALQDPQASALFLVPEVALAPQTVGNLRSRLESMGVRVLVWHSHLSDGERRDSWLKIARGEARVVVGARSAVFTPMRNLRW